MSRLKTSATKTGTYATRRDPSARDYSARGHGPHSKADGRNYYSSLIRVREAAEIDPASFIASLDPSLRQAVLLDQDDTFLQSLPPHMIAEVDVYCDELQARRNRGSEADGIYKQMY